MVGGEFVVKTGQNLRLREQALQHLRESTELFKQAVALLKANKKREGETVLGVARAKRFESALLMLQAKKLERDN